MEGINIPQGSVVISIEEYDRFREMEKNQDRIKINTIFSNSGGRTFVRYIGKDEAIAEMQSAADATIKYKDETIKARDETIAQLETILAGRGFSFSRRLRFLFIGRLETK
jgi:hypothetical protein